MPRVHYITFVTNSQGVGVTGATVTVAPRYFATPCSVYQNSSGSLPLATPIETVNGKAEFWLDDEVAYNITITGTGFQDYTHYFDAVSAETVNTIRTHIDSLDFGGSNPSFGSPVIYGVLGVGTSTPRGRIEAASYPGKPAIVADGLVTATPGIRFSDGTYQTTAATVFGGYATPIPAGIVNFAQRADYATPIAAGIINFAQRADYATPMPRQFRIPHTIAVGGQVSTPTAPATGVIPGWFMPIATGQTTNIIHIRGRIDSTTPIVMQLQKNGAPAGGTYNSFPVNGAGQIVATGNISVSSGDYFQAIVLQQAATPAYNLSLTVVSETTI